MRRVVRGRRPGWCRPMPARVLFLFLIFMCLWGSAARGAESGDPVYVVEVSGTIDGALAAVVSQGVSEAEARGAEAVVIRIDTPGGQVDAALRIRDVLLGAAVPTVALVDSRAWSAGALIALACERIAVVPGASIGAAEPIPASEKNISAVRAEFEATAEARGRDPDLAAAMVDASISLPDVVDEGKLLTLRAGRALELGLADLEADGLRPLLEQLDLGGARVQRFEPTVGQNLARFLTNPIVSAVLLAVGFIGIIIEVVSPGFGVPGVLGLLGLGLYFFAHIVAGAAGWWALLLFVGGVVLLATEIIVPGFGVFGVGGILAVLAAIFLAAGSPEQAALSLTIALGITVAAIAVSWRLLRRRGFFSRLALLVSQAPDAGYVAPRDQHELEGAVGRALTNLRPAGAVSIDGRRVDAVTEGDYIRSGTPVRVLRVEGSRVIVAAVEPPGDAAGAEDE